jgi:hypothetical protein
MVEGGRGVRLDSPEKKSMRGEGRLGGWWRGRVGGWLAPDHSFPSFLPNQVTRQQAGKIMPAGALTSLGGGGKEGTVEALMVEKSVVESPLRVHRMR